MPQAQSFLRSLKNGAGKARIVAGALCLAAILEYVIAEAVAAMAWKNPPYNYARYYISDLGVSGPPEMSHGSMVYSPLYYVMNSAFFIEGVLAIAAALLLRKLLINKSGRVTVSTLAILHGIGMFGVAIVHGSPEMMHNPIGAVHVIGASLAIILGNTECICAGIAARRSGAPAWFKNYSVFMGVFGLLGLAALLGWHSIPFGITERISVYTIIGWDITTGIFLLGALSKLKASEAIQ
jgi:hypothetical membrane protein